MATISVGSSFVTSWIIPMGYATITESNLRLVVSDSTGTSNTYYSSTDGTTVGLFTIVQATASLTGSITALALSIATAGKHYISLESLASTDSNKNVYTVLCKTQVIIQASDTTVSAGTIA